MVRAAQPSRSRSWQWPRREDERATALVELVIVIPVVMCLTLGAFTGGDAYFRKITVTDAVREGARYGASLAVPSGVGGATSWEDSVKARVAQASGGELTASVVCVKLVYPTGGTDCGVSDPSGASSESTVRLVKVSASKNATMQFFFLTQTFTLTGKVAGRYERDRG